MPQFGFVAFENASKATAMAQPNFAALANTYANYTNYWGTSSPSLPDYEFQVTGTYSAAWSAGQFGGFPKGKDGPSGIAPGYWGAQQNLFGQIIQKGGISWKSYEEGVSGTGGYTTWGPAGTSNLHVSRHCPACFFTSSNVRGASHGNGRYDFDELAFDITNSSLPDFFFITPNTINDGHDTQLPPANTWVASGGSWASGITGILGAMRPDGLLAVWFDNIPITPTGSGTINPLGTGNIFMVIAGPGVTHSTNATYFHHGHTLKAIQGLFGLSTFSSGVDSHYTSATALPLPGTAPPPPDTTPPNAPTTISATPVSSSSITVAWDGATDNVGVTHYKVFRDGSGVAAADVSTKSWPDTNLAAASTHSYRVEAFDAAGNPSPLSAAASATTLPAGDTQAPSIPTGVNASATGSTAVHVSWNPSTDDSGTVSGYNVIRDGVQVGTAASTSFNDSNLTPSTTYGYSVNAFDPSNNTSGNSAQVSVTTQAGGGGGGAVSFRATTNSGNGTTSASVNPTFAQAGDLMLAHVTAVGAATVTPPSGWTIVNSAADSTAIVNAVYSKTAAAGEASATWTVSGATGMRVTYSYVIGGATVRTSATTHSAGTAVTSTPGSALSSLQANDEVCTFISTGAGPRPWADTGCVFGVMPNPSDWSTQTGIAAIETTVNHKLAMAHSMVPWDCHAGLTNGDFAASGNAPTVDYNNNRLTYTSWPRPRAGANTSETSWNSVFGSTDPATVFGNIASGTYDGIIDGNANAYKAFGQAKGAVIIIRMFWEMNEGGVIFDVGKSASPTTYQTNFVAAWQHIVTRTRAIAQNVLFHWNPGNFQTTAISRDQLYPGDSYVDFTGTEYYMSPGDTFTSIQTNTSSNGHTYLAIYAGYGPGSSHKKLEGCGEGGCRKQTGEADATVNGRVQSIITGAPQFTGVKFYVWWNGNGPQGDSIIQDQGPLTTTSISNMISSAYFTPNLDWSWKPITQNQVYEWRRPLAAASGTNYGAGQLGATLAHTTQASPGASTALSATTWGYGKWASVTVALTSGGNPPPPSQPFDTFTVQPSVTVIQENPAWGPATDALAKEYGRVDAIAYDPVNNITYVGGNMMGTNSIQQKDGTKVSQNFLFAVDMSTYELIATWVPNPTAGTDANGNPTGRVFDIKVSADGATVYVAGAFTSIGSTPTARHNIAALHAATAGNTGTVLSSLPDLGFNGTIRDMSFTADGGTLIVGGDFTNATAAAVTRLAKINVAAGSLVATWLPTANLTVRDVHIDDQSGVVTVAGDYTLLNGAAHNYLGGVSLTSGASTAWSGIPSDRCLCIVGDRAGTIWDGTVSDQVEKHAVSTGNLIGQTEDSDGNIQALKYWPENGSGSIVCGYHGDCIGNTAGVASGSYNGTDCGIATGLVLHKAFNLDASTLSYDQNFNPNLTSTAGVLGVWAIEAKGSTLVLGGDFTKTNGTTRPRLAFYVASVGGGGGGPDVDPPSPPQNLSATAVSSTSIRLNWTASVDNVGVTSYQVYRVT